MTPQQSPTSRRAGALTRLAASVKAITKARDDEIRSWRADGGSLREIAAAANMSPQGIANICAAEPDER